MRSDVEKSELRLVVGLVAIEALGWSALSMMLASDGHAPSGPTLLPFDDYAAQAWFAPLVVGISFALQTMLVTKFGRVERAVAATIASVGVSMPMILLWQCGDMLAYAAGGFEAMRAAMRVTVPLALLMTIVLVTVLSRRRGIGTAKSIALGVGVLFVRGLVFAPFIR